ncbi:hypothetical protein DSO57_1004777 [Entomophthora muscae]|uniref:Uncharacterized protein n=1 Tax=Entomophthora muscae TaxID=34485 RepID=A0ACC2UTC0_9FUNG|nr:hypothetical protein DSO57_1004777 [Entomophthora muscae]
MKVGECVLHREVEANSRMGLAHLWYVLEWESLQDVPNKLNRFYTVNSTEEYQVQADNLGILVGSNCPLRCPLSMQKRSQCLPGHWEGTVN